MRALLLTLVCLNLLACAKDESSKEVPTAEVTNGVGPFDMELGTETAAKPQSFSVDINQDEGAVDYFVKADPGIQYLVLDSYSSKVTGCDASRVTVTPYWYSDEAKPTPLFVSIGNTMIVDASKRGVLKFAFQKLNGCSHLDFTVSVRKLPVGALQPQLDPNFSGTWAYGTAPGLTISMFIGTSRLGWLEGKGTTWTCDREFYPSTSTESDGGWMVAHAGGMVCRYRFTTSDKKTMTMNCFGRNSYGCTVPQNFQFKKY